MARDEDLKEGKPGVGWSDSGKWSRRDFLKKAGIAAAAGLTLNSWVFSEKESAAISCCDLSVLSKHLEASVPALDFQECEYYGQKVWIATAKLVGEIQSIEPCDETGGFFPEGSVLEAYEVEHYFRLCDPCDTPVGMFRSVGPVRIKHPSGRILAESTTVGALRGTVGFESGADRRCCGFPWGMGSLELSGCWGTEIEGCFLQATFRIRIPIEPEQLFKGEPWEAWIADLDGVTNCPFQ